jgi:hypothetical protein
MTNTKDTPADDEPELWDANDEPGRAGLAGGDRHRRHDATASRSAS